MFCGPWSQMSNFANHMRLSERSTCLIWQKSLLLNYKFQTSNPMRGVGQTASVWDRIDWCVQHYSLCVSAEEGVCVTLKTLLIIFFLWAAHHCGTKSLQCPQQTWEKSRMRKQVKCKRTLSRHLQMNQCMNEHII